MDNDLRTWLKQVEGIGRLKRIKGADWNLEIGCLTSLNVMKKGPVLLFDGIPGYPPDYGVITCSNMEAGTLAVTMGMPPANSDRDLLAVLGAKFAEWEKKIDSFPPQTVREGPLLENVHSGADLDVLAFPAPKYHEEDGGRYIGTGCAIITADPDTGEVNLGTYRIMVHDSKTVAIYMEPDRHARSHIGKYHRKGKPAPVAISVGQHPAIFRVAGIAVRSGGEYGFCGAMLGKPVEVVTEEITGLPVPAAGEIVLAGWCPPSVTRPEGPFGEWTGYYGSSVRPAPVIEVARIYHRNSPILLGSPPDRPARSQGNYASRMFNSALLHKYLSGIGIPGVVGVCLSDAAHRQIIAVCIKQQYYGHSKQAALAVTQSRIGTNVGRYVIVVDEDVDFTDINDVLWAVGTRADPEKAIDIIRRAPSSPLDPLIGTRTEVLLNSRAIIDACIPYEWRDKFPKAIQLSDELVARVKDKFKGQL
ncbi:MAG: UbiD family decarboxylase [Chloroflexi bacterium]|nr:UbiD family decarboxylase [Chloroflexota bacterium]